jgi:hypothetical protein
MSTTSNSLNLYHCSLDYFDGPPIAGGLSLNDRQQQQLSAIEVLEARVCAVEVKLGLAPTEFGATGLVANDDVSYLLCEGVNFAYTGFMGSGDGTSPIIPTNTNTKTQQGTQEPPEQKQQKQKQKQKQKGGKGTVAKGTKPKPAAPAAEPWKPPAELYPLIDIGLNLSDDMYDGKYNGKQKHEADRALVLERAAQSGVEKMMLTGGCLEDSKAVLALARTDSTGALFSTVGVHPTRCDEMDAGGDADTYLAELLALCKDGQSDGRVVAIGECGLDYERLHFCSKEVQLRNFEKQLLLAEQTGLPLFLHCRAAATDLVEM